MKTNEIFHKLKKFKIFKGVYPRDMIPNFECDYGIVVNTDTSAEPGTHWVAIFVEDNKGEYFDSFGLPPLTSDVLNVLNRLKYWKYNTTTIQDVNSTKCCEFCIAFIAHRAHGFTMEQFLQLFARDEKHNDVIIEQLVSRYK